MSLTWSELYSTIITCARQKKELITASFELTARCNLQCKMCYVCQPANNVKVMSEELSTKQWLRLAEEARDLGLLYLTLTGGEVFLRKDFKEIYEQLTKLGLVIQIYTNGTLVSPEIVEWLSKIPPYKMSITLYGASRETYHNVTGFAQGYDKAVQAIDSLLAAGISTEVKTSVVRGNEHDFDQLSEFALQRGLVLGLVNYISPRREGDNSDPLGNRLTPSQLVQYENHMRERNRQLNKSIAFTEDPGLYVDIFEEHRPLALDKTESGRQKSEHNDAFVCSAGKCGAWVTWDGRLLPCGIMSEIEEFPILHGFKAAWQDLKDKCFKIAPCKECQECEYLDFCESCPARLQNESGHFDKAAPYLCETAKLRSQYF